MKQFIGLDNSNEIWLELKDILETQLNNNPLFVDMGLSVKWCNVNVGANKPTDYGGYFAWGETEEKNNYSDSNYDSHKPVEDVAQMQGMGRTPTDEEFEELARNADCLYAKCNGVFGCYIISKINCNCIFLPAAGYRWLKENYGIGVNGFYRCITKNYHKLIKFGSKYKWRWYHRSLTTDGCSIRSVSK